MESTKTTENRSLIEKEAAYIVQYVRSFQVHTGKDETALTEILSMLNNLHAAIDRIEESHQRRIILMEEMRKTVSAMEDEQRQFVEKHKNVASN